MNGLDDHKKTLERTIAHLTNNGVDLAKSPRVTGPHLKFNPKEEVFVGAPEANTMLTREYRKDFVCPKPDQV